MTSQPLTDQYIFICDLCKTESRQSTSHRPAFWQGIDITRSAVDCHDNECADASLHFDFCRNCSALVTEAINSVLKP